MDSTLSDLLHIGGLLLAVVGAGVAMLLPDAAADACIAIVAGAALCLVTHQPGVHGPEGD